jgi:Domain of unknown function (DUF4279)
MLLIQRVRSLEISANNDSKGDKIGVALYVRGQRLDPDAVTRLLGVQPTRVQRTGDVRSLPSGNQAVANIGLWAKIIDSDGGKAEDVLVQLLSEVTSSVSLVTKLPDVTEAYFDIFIARPVGSDGRSDFSLSFNNGTLTALAVAALPLEITIAAVPEEASSAPSKDQI